MPISWGRSVGDMYLGAIGPSILQVLIFVMFIFILSLVRQKIFQRSHWKRAGDLNMKLVWKVLAGMVPLLC